MTRYNNNDLVGEIQSRIDIVDLVSETVDLTRKGNRYWGKCPFHQENTASFCVTPEKNMFYCFGCNTGGDIFTFVMKRDNLDFRGALDTLASKAGIQRASSTFSKGLGRRKRITSINTAVAEFYQQSLMQKKGQAKNYLTNRNINEAMINAFKIGYADESWDSLERYMLKQGYLAKDLREAGLIRYSEKANKNYDLFRNRIMFPIFSYNGEIIGFGGRVLDDQMPKYINSPETDIFSKGRNLYGLYQSQDFIRKLNQIILVEGYIDCIKLHQYGICNVAATLGTAFTKEQAELIKRNAEEVIILYDADEAGQRETLKVIDILSKSDIQINVVTLPGSIDPDEYLDLYGKEDFLYFLKNNKISYIEYKLNWYINEADEIYTKDKVRIINSLRPDYMNLNSAIEKDNVIKLISRKLEIRENIVYQEFNLNRRQADSGGIKRNKKQIIRDNKRYYDNYSLEEKIVATMLKDADIKEIILEHDILNILSEPKLKKVAFLIKEFADNDNLQLEELIRENEMETIWARILMCAETTNLESYELKDYLRQVVINREQEKWGAMHHKLASINDNGDFNSMLNFILSFKEIMRTTQEGGI